jgi:hypothetical protein
MMQKAAGAAMDIANRRRRVTRLSATTRIAALALAIALPVLAAGYWGFASGPEIALAAGLGPVPLALDVPARIGAAFLSVLPVLALSWGLCRLAATLRLFSVGQPFAPAAAHGLRDFGAGVIACAVLKPVAGAMLSVLVTWSGPKALAVSISSDTLLLLLLGAAMTLLGWAFGEAAALAEENAQFV